MELIIGLIILYFLWKLLMWFIEYILPWLLRGGGIVVLIILAAGAVVGFWWAIRNYITAVRSNMNFSDWTWKKSDEPSKRSYFFGPGYQQLKGTIKTSFALNKAYVDDHQEAFILYRIALMICIYLLGTFLTVAIAAIHGSITTVVMLITYIIFSVVWVLDRIYLLLHRIRSVCPYCKHRSLIAHYECPQCHAIHKRLVPGPYGVMNHTCECGYRLPSTFFNGRSKLISYCPIPGCGAKLVTTGARQVGFQLIGGSRAGKSVFLASLFHQYLEKLHSCKKIRVTITPDYKPYFDELESWYQGGDTPPTNDKNSQMYPILLDGVGDTKRQFSIYDVAGELFAAGSTRGNVVQEQFSYCDGLMFVLDPFSDGGLRRSRQQAGEALGDFSMTHPDEVASNFINYMVEIGKAKPGQRSNIPMAVLIVKSDAREVKSVIGPAKINLLVRQGKYSSLMEARDKESRQFLTDIGLGGVIGILEMQFTNLHYFPVSAMGHSPDGDPYEPWGVMEVLDWLIPLADEELARAMKM